MGYEGSRSPRYRHADRKSVKADILENEFSRLIAALTVRTDVIPKMVEQLTTINQQQLTPDRKEEMLAEIHLCRQRIRNAEKLFMMARLDEESLRKHIGENENQIAHLQAVMNEEGHIRQMIEVTATMLAEMGGRWQDASAEDKHAFAHTLFSEVIFDIDTHRITGFALKAWAAQFLQISAAHHAEQNGAVLWLEGFKHNAVPFRVTRYPTLQRRRTGLHLCAHCSETVKNRQVARNAQIYQFHLQGTTNDELAKRFQLSEKHIERILRERKLKGSN